jgi:hypothetical protein
LSDPNGAQFEIIVDSKPRSYRNNKTIAIAAAQFLKERAPASTVSVRDMRDNSVTTSAWENGNAIGKP